MILDVRAHDEAGRRYNIEVQLRAEGDYFKRSLYYLAKLFSEQLGRGESYATLPKTVGISLLDFRLFDREALHSCFQMHEREAKFRLTDVFELRGLQQGLQQGVQQGKRELAGRMLAIGMAAEQVAELSGLSLQEIQSISFGSEAGRRGQAEQAK